MKDSVRNLLQKVIFVAIILAIWEAAARAKVFGPRSEIIFPTLEAIGAAFIKNFVQGYAGMSLWAYLGNSMKLLLAGMGIGIGLAFLFSGLSMVSRTFHNLYNLVVAVADLLPGVALLPVIIIIFGVKPGVIVFLVVHSVIWPMSRNLIDGFKSVPRIFVEAGMNMGLSRAGLLFGVFIPAAMTYIVSGLKVGWARAWRGLISAEMIFGIASAPGIGLIVQYGILNPIEKNTVAKWGMLKT